MQLTELLFQKVKDLGAQGQLALRPGYVAIVSKAAALRAALVAPLFPGPDDQRLLVDGGGPTRVGVGMLGADGTPVRILRELGASRFLQKLDAATGRFVNVTEDALEIDSFLRVECGFPAADAYTGFFVIEVNELPSLRGKAAAAANEAYVDQGRVKALRDELELTKKFEGTQDRLFKVQQRLLELGQVHEKVKEGEDELAGIETELARSPWTPEQLTDLLARAARAKDDLRKRDEALADIVTRRPRALHDVPPPPDPLLKDPWFGGGLASGVLLDAIAFFLRRPSIALLGLLPFAAALVAALRFIGADEADKEAASTIKELKEREESVRRTYEAEQAPLKAALKAADADSPAELLELFRAREAVVARHTAAKARVDKLREEPDLPRVQIETPVLESERARLEDSVLTMGFSRPIAEIELDLRHALGLSDSRRVVLPDAEVPKHLVERAAELLNLSSEELWEQLAPRLSAYLGALTDKRVVSGKPDAGGLLVVAAADGRSGPFMSLPLPLRDLVYVALRLALLEKVAAYKRVPIVIDDGFATLEAPKRALLAKMLKGISSQTQVIHRSIEPPPAGTADVVLQA